MLLPRVAPAGALCGYLNRAVTPRWPNLMADTGLLLTDVKTIGHVANFSKLTFQSVKKCYLVPTYNNEAKIFVQSRDYT